MVGSHADKINKAQQRYKESIVTKLVKKRVKTLEYVGFVSMDCRYFDYSEFSKPLFSLINECHRSIYRDRCTFIRICVIMNGMGTKWPA